MFEIVANIPLNQGRSGTNNRNLYKSNPHVYGHPLGQSNSAKLFPTHREITGQPLKSINTMECSARRKFADPLKSFQFLEKQYNSKVQAKHSILPLRSKHVKAPKELQHFQAKDKTEGYHQMQKSSRYFRQHPQNQQHLVRENMDIQASKSKLINTLYDLRFKHLETASGKWSQYHLGKFFEVIKVNKKSTKLVVKHKPSITSLNRQTGGNINSKNGEDKTPSISITSSSDILRNDESEHTDRAHKLRMDYLRLINSLKSGRRPRDNEVVFGNACYYFPGRRYGWEKSRIEWLQRLESQSHSRAGTMRYY